MSFVQGQKVKKINGRKVGKIVAVLGNVCIVNFAKETTPNTKFVQVKTSNLVSV